MANQLYVNAKNMILRGQFNWESDTVRVALLSLGSYIPDFAAHAFLSDVPQQAVVAVSQPLANKQVSGGACLADSVLLESVSGPQVNALLLYIDRGSPETSPLLALIDTGYQNLPVEPNGGDIRVLWPQPPDGIFRL